MKSRVVWALVVLIGVALVLPGAAYPGPPHYYRYGGCYGGCGHWDGWAVGAAVAGGILAAVIVGSIIADQTASKPYPARPSEMRPAGERTPAYAYPDPDFVAKYGGTAPAKPASGEWVTVPGQSVGGLWVPEHKVWVPSGQE